MAKKKTKEAQGVGSEDAARAMAVAEGEEASKSLGLVRRIDIKDAAGLQFAAAATAEIKERWEAVDEKRREFTEPLNKVVKDLNAFFRPALAALAECEAVLKGKIAAYHDAQIQARGRLLAQAGEASKAGDGSAAQALVAQAEEAISAKVDGVKISTRWTGRVTDVSKIPREHMIPDLKSLEAATRSHGGDPGIPGWEAVPLSSVAITADEVRR